MISVRFQFQSLRSMGRVISSSARGLLALLVLLGWHSLSTGLVLAQEYQDPDFEFVVFDQDALSLQGQDRVLVAEALAALASNFHPKVVDMDLREKALAIALRLDSLNASARATRQALLNGRNPEQTEYFQNMRSLINVLRQAAERMQEQYVEPEDATPYSSTVGVVSGD